MMLSPATAAGKTFIAANLLWRIAEAGQLRRALFLCGITEGDASLINLKARVTFIYSELFSVVQYAVFAQLAMVVDPE